MNGCTHLRACLCLQSPQAYYTINNFFTVFSCFILVFHLNIFWEKNKNKNFFFFVNRVGIGPRENGHPSHE